MFRFSDPRLEKLYCNYYAQVKGNLLPTAIQVALLTNVVQLVATCLRGLTGTPWIIALALQLSTLCVSYLALRRVRADLDASRNNSDDNDRRLDVRVSIGSGLSASLSLAIEPESDNDDDDEEHHQRQHQNPADNHFRLLQRSKVDGAKRASTLSNQNNLTKLPRFQLLLPYILWLCQMVQLASGLWPQLSFISYSILLLYSYTIYVIVPIRLTSCLVLALLLSVSQPVVDHLILLNLQPESQPLSHLLHLLHTRSTGSISLPSFLLAASSTAPPPLSHHPQAPVNHYPSAANFRHQASQPNQANYLQFYPSISSSLSSASIRQPRASVYQDTLAANETANSLLIPMTSHMPKLLAFILLVVGINLIGVMSFFFYERQQRAAFLETRQSLETKLTLEQESQEQVSTSNQTHCEPTQLEPNPLNASTLLDLVTLTGASLVVHPAQTPSCGNTPRSRRRSHWPVQENLHESARECEHSFRRYRWLHCHLIALSSGRVSEHFERAVCAIRQARRKVPSIANQNSR